jgi:hypothetical protein
MRRESLFGGQERIGGVTHPCLPKIHDSKNGLNDIFYNAELLQGVLTLTSLTHIPIGADQFPGKGPKSSQEGFPSTIIISSTHASQTPSKST